MESSRFTQPEKYTYFSNPERRKYAYELSREIAQYLHDQNIPNIILLDRSARTAWVGIDQYWKSNYKGEKRPNIYFINPDAFDVLTNYIKKNKIPQDYILVDKLKYAATGESEIMKSSRSAADAATAQFAEAYRTLAEALDKPLAVYDNCTHSKYTMSLMISWLQKAGYENLHVLIGDVSRQDRSQFQAETDETTGKRVRAFLCDPFGQGISGVQKGNDVFSNYNTETDRESVVRIRKEIRRVIQNKGD